MIVIAAGAGGGVLIIVGIITVLIIVKRKKKKSKMVSMNGTSSVQSFNSTARPIINKTIAVHPEGKTTPESYRKTKGILSPEMTRENKEINCQS